MLVCQLGKPGQKGLWNGRMVEDMTTPNMEKNKNKDLKTEARQ